MADKEGNGAAVLIRSCAPVSGKLSWCYSYNRVDCSLSGGTCNKLSRKVKVKDSDHSSPIFPCNNVWSKTKLRKDDEQVNRFREALIKSSCFCLFDSI